MRLGPATAAKLAAEAQHEVEDLKRGSEQICDDQAHWEVQLALAKHAGTKPDDLGPQVLQTAWRAYVEEQTLSMKCADEDMFILVYLYRIRLAYSI